MSYVSHLSCSVCRAEYPAGRVMNLCERDSRPLQMVLDLERLKAERGRDGWWNPSRRDLWRFGGLLPLDVDDPDDRRHVITRGEGCTPCLPYAHPLADRLGCRLEVKDEGKHYPGFGGNPTLSFKDRGMAMTVSMARSLGLTRLAVPTQGNAGDSLAEYAVAAGIEAVIVMSPDTDLPVLGKSGRLRSPLSRAGQAGHRAGNDHRLRQARARRICSARLFQRRHLPGARLAHRGKEDAGARDGRAGRRSAGGTALAAPRRDRLSDRRRNGRGRHGQGVRRARGAGPGRAASGRGWSASRARPARRSCGPSNPVPPTSSRSPPAERSPPGLNVAQNLGHVNVLRIIRATGGCAISVSEEAIRATIRDEWRDRRFAWSPEGRRDARRRFPSWPIEG